MDPVHHLFARSRFPSADQAFSFLDFFFKNDGVFSPFFFLSFLSFFSLRLDAYSVESLSKFNQNKFQKKEEI